MSLSSPNLDDRDFRTLVEQAKQRIAQTCPQWTDLSPGDPGIVLLELFAHLTETMIYRLNRLPNKAYIEFLSLMGVHLQPPSAARVELHFKRNQTDVPLEIPRGTRVTLNRTAGGSEPPIFSTVHTITLQVGEHEGRVLAFHCDLVAAELAGMGTGLPQFVVSARHPPIIAPTGDDLDLVVGTETPQEDLSDRVPALQYNGKTYRIWREVQTFANLGSDGFVYVADRLQGRITFAPAGRTRWDAGLLEAQPRMLAALPIANREVRLWYRRGGGLAGNVPANTLTVLKDAIPGVEVTNPSAATGGRSAETLENALIRGPQELHSLQRAVTARDFELLALSSSRTLARAKAFARASLWTHAAPGTVEVLLVPYLAQQDGQRVDVATLQAHETAAACEQIQKELDQRRPLGTTCLVNWAHYKSLRVSLRIVVRREENLASVQQRVLHRLYETINPLPTQINPAGWPFGQALRASHIYDIALAEPGVRWVDQVKLIVDDVPNAHVRSLAADVFQPRTWYASSSSRLFRSLNDGNGWESVRHFSDEQVRLVRTHPTHAGLVAVITQREDESGSRLYISRDCGEMWESGFMLTFDVQDCVWVPREGIPVIMMATDGGLYEQTLHPDASPVQILVNPSKQHQGFFALATAQNLRGEVSVAVAAQGQSGVFLSRQGGMPASFASIGLEGEDIRTLAVQSEGPNAYLWAGTASAGGDDPGKGCFMWDMNSAGGWQPFGRGWSGGSCRAFAFAGTTVLAGSHRSGVLRLDRAKQMPEWETPDVSCGLPLRDRARFQPIDSVAVVPDAHFVLASGSDGVFGSADKGVTYNRVSHTEFTEKVALPESWLFCSGNHEVIVVSEHETE
ncbi:baseplate J/gp47 family protein [Candidatus Chloroploca sp. M-50]|uniref:Baseplate J/gp47 family protein n=1 Tax=Candidatus Chloroploca mongolica TaxID=2528176 RepID=A0ABM7GKL8_9CHLR|nr:baseplate J/gp47 family protein [Candidatus Chloroploca mongolica]MBP1466289.1 baseplate J/gp47 family protein [Candidatus Chloroploca mongolica]